MAKSLDKKDLPSFINDDMIREALKTGLKSLQASDDLVRETLSKCQNEIVQGKNSHKARAYMPWVYKLGTPLAAGALILVLALNNNSLKSSDNYTAAAPQASAQSSGAESPEDGGTSAEKKDAERSSNDVELKFNEAIAPTVAPAPDIGSGDVAIGFSKGSAYTTGLYGLNSSPNRSKNESHKEQAEPLDAFNGAVIQYNTAKGTQFTLNEAGVTRVQTVFTTGIQDDMIIKASSYKELLSGEGYWALPLMNTNDVMEGLLTVNVVDQANSNMTVSSNDLLYTFNDVDYLISAHPAGARISKSFEMMFDTSGLVDLAEAKGYKTVSEPVVVDINYGMDFLVFMEADQQELAIPFLLDENLFGLENMKMYARNELFKIIGQQMKQ